MILLTAEHIRQIEEHGERDFPRECGGLIVGSFNSENDKTVVELLPMENQSAPETRHNRVLILPADLLKAERYARSKKLDVVGYYHSHPDDEAVPSGFDLEHALPVWSYIIVSIRAGKAVDLRSWVMQNDRAKFNSEEIVLATEQEFSEQ